MALPNMVAENASQSSVASSNSGFPKYDETDPEGSRFKIEIALSKHKERPHLSLLPAPVNPGGRAAEDLRDAFRQNMEIYRRQEEVGYALILEATYSCPSALEVAMLYHKSQLAAVPPKPRSGKELLDILDARFRGERVSLLEESIGKYNSWKVGDEEKLMIAVDRLKTLIQRLASLGNVVTEASKIERIKDGLKSAKYKLLVVSMAMQPPNTTFDQFVSMIKNFDKATQDEASWGIGESSLGEIHLLSSSQKKFLRNKKDVLDDRQVPGSKSFTGCHECGARDHLKQDCPKLEERDISNKPKSSRKRGHQEGDQSERIAALEAEIQRLKESNTDHKKKKSKTVSKKGDWSKYVRKDDRGSDEESDEE
jgi:hypothetical protein